ncbi:hypothetical protein ABDK00_004615 [Niabella insulamsoli]|uniref:hypothetical protein n=1 Tax=Niabella insulamsoli TaxID=3144874 RepID=UPI0031FC677E
MKKRHTLTAILIALTLWAIPSKAQNEKRYVIEMSFTYEGKTVKAPLSSASYSINRDVYDEDSSYAAKKVIYYSVVPQKLEKELLMAIKNKKASYDIRVTMTDSYGKEPQKETLLKKAMFTNITESYAPYSYEYGSSVSLGISASSIVVDGVELQP